MARFAKIAVLFLVVSAALPVMAMAGFKDQTQCPEGMVSIDGKYCIDVYEYPNKKGEYSLNAVKWSMAEELCTIEGKRLCTLGEWQNACMGPQDNKYPYGNDYQKGVCSDPYAADGPGHYPSGAWGECANRYGVYDMSGNLWEWTSDAYADGKMGIQGGSAITANAQSLSCLAASKENPQAIDGYIGFRCCADIQATNVRNTASPLTLYPPVSDEEGFYQSAEYTMIPNIVNATDINSDLDASGFNVTAGYNFENMRIDYTRIEYKIESMLYGVSENGHVKANMLHAAVLLPIQLNFGKWTGSFAAGARVLDSNFGWMNEAYASRELNYDRWSITPSVNYVSSKVSSDSFGYALDARYHLTSHINIMGNYSYTDFYKTFVNDYITPNSSVYSTVTTHDCPRDSTSAGLMYEFPNRSGGLYLMYYDIGDLDVPVGGTTIFF